MANARQCECGEWSGESCEWSGTAAEMVTVEWMPEHLRQSHADAGNSGSWPHNGAIRSAVELSCAERMIECDGHWARIVSESVDA